MCHLRSSRYRADWCVKEFKEANHSPVVALAHGRDLKVRPGATVQLSARGSSDLDDDELVYRWWHYREPGSYDGTIEIRNAGKQNASFMAPGGPGAGETVHIVCEVTDNGTPRLTRYQRVILTVQPYLDRFGEGYPRKGPDPWPKRL